MNEQMNTFTARRHTTDGMSEMVACANCGVMIPAHAKFCGKCGQSNVPAPKVDVVDATPAVLPQESFCPNAVRSWHPVPVSVANAECRLPVQIL